MSKCHIFLALHNLAEPRRAGYVFDVNSHASPVVWSMGLGLLYRMCASRFPSSVPYLFPHQHSQESETSFI